MANAETKLMTADEFYEFVHQPENRDREFDLVQGVVVPIRRIPNRYRGFVCANIGVIVGNYGREDGTHYGVLGNVGVIVAKNPDTVRGTDFMLFQSTANPGENTWVNHAPVLAVEVPASNQPSTVTEQKIREHLAFGTRWIWIADIVNQRVTTIQPNQPRETFDGPDVLQGGDILPGFQCKVAEFFDFPGWRKN